LYNRLKPIKSKKSEEKMGVVNLHRKEGGHFQPDLGGQYHRILHCMNKTIKNIGFLLLIFTISCGQNLDFIEILKNEKQFELKVNPNGNLSLDSSLTTKISADSEIISNLKTWLKNNPSYWESSIASWATPDISLIGSDFRLLIFKDFVVVGFTDKSGKQKQYTKGTNESEFNFLTRKNE